MKKLFILLALLTFSATGVAGILTIPKSLKCDNNDQCVYCSGPDGTGTCSQRPDLSVNGVLIDKVFNYDQSDEDGLTIPMPAVNSQGSSAMISYVSKTGNGFYGRILVDTAKIIDYAKTKSDPHSKYIQEYPPVGLHCRASAEECSIQTL